MEQPKLSVIIPTYNRSKVLEMTLNALCCGQKGDLPIWEVIVVDDGSTDDTPNVLTKLKKKYHNLTYISQENKKQGAARNTAMQIAKGELFIFLGDDIIPENDFLNNHWRSYLTDGMNDTYAAIGRTCWHKSIKITPFREWINEWGLQFGFSLIDDTENAPFNFFYTSNIAFSRIFYDKLGGFDESFREYGWEDIELGYRYQKKGGMRLKYIPTAMANHLHDLTIPSFCTRQFKVGYSAVFFHSLYPELATFLKIKKIKPVFKLTKPILWLAAKFFQFCDERGVDTIRITHKILIAYYFLGMYKAQKELSYK